MIEYDTRNWVKFIFNSDTKTIFTQIKLPLILLSIYTAAIVLFFNHIFIYHFPGTTAVHSLLGIILGLFLVFRTNTAYERWWEGRKQWGLLVNCSRNLAIKIQTSLPKDNTTDKEFFAIMISNFVFAFKEHLRKGVKFDEIKELESIDFKAKLKEKSHKPVYIIQLMYARFNELRDAKTISQEQYWIIDQEMKEFLDILGACERIKNTPIPYSYNIYLKKFIFIYSITLPFGLISITHYWTIPIVVIIFYLIVSTELIAEEIEEPFGLDENDLPADLLCTKIKANVNEVLCPKNFS